jgi:hypothetical protein
MCLVLPRSTVIHCGSLNRLDQRVDWLPSMAFDAENVVPSCDEADAPFGTGTNSVSAQAGVPVVTGWLSLPRLSGISWSAPRPSDPAWSLLQATRQRITVPMSNHNRRAQDATRPFPPTIANSCPEGMSPVNFAYLKYVKRSITPHVDADIDGPRSRMDVPTL